MPPDPFSYAAVRVVPDIEREEFLNAGLILFCRPRRFLRARTALDEQALETLHPGCDAGALRGQLRLIERIAEGDETAGSVARMEPSERFHWLTAPRSTVVQPGPIHTGMTDDPAATFDHLFARLVERR
ncbi:MAG TPA: DUF3037 domain-containing protein [candidate division Zixibacteria bacterium]|nr:DUF3037 domain-containing protein [candidate division Zixibacteria bacterium]